MTKLNGSFEKADSVEKEEPAKPSVAEVKPDVKPAPAPTF